MTLTQEERKDLHDFQTMEEIVNLLTEEYEMDYYTSIDMAGKITEYINRHFNPKYERLESIL